MLTGQILEETILHNTYTNNEDLIAIVADSISIHTSMYPSILGDTHIYISTYIQSRYRWRLRKREYIFYVSMMNVLELFLSLYF